ncbi:MAG: hypothetical protein NC177_11000 [Ruminococcus flavefaciens]|nr:hypothetical protein [Ruminococcus flavefaciens]
MNEQDRELLKRKLDENKRRLKEIRINEEKSRIMQEVENFPEKYHFADDDEKERIENFMERIPSKFPKNPVTAHGKCYLCFLCGSLELFDIYIYGNFSDFLHDYDDFFFFSPYLLVIDEDFRRFVHIDDEFNITESYIGE